MRRRTASDYAAVALAIAIHGAALLLILLVHNAPPTTLVPSPMLRVFDVAPLPPPPPEPLPVKPPPIPVKAPPGGSPPPSPAPPEAPDTNAQPLAPSLSPATPLASPFSDDQGLTQLAGIGGGEGRGAGSGTGSGDGAGSGSDRYAPPDWIYKPGLSEALPYWPPLAVRKRIAGQVHLACLVPKPGRPKRCWILSESPAGIGFGRAALALSRLFRLKPVLRNGVPLDVPVGVPVVFAVAAIPAAPKP